MRSNRGITIEFVIHINEFLSTKLTSKRTRIDWNFISEYNDRIYLIRSFPSLVIHIFRKVCLCRYANSFINATTTKKRIIKQLEPSQIDWVFNKASAPRGVLFAMAEGISTALPSSTSSSDNGATILEG